MKRRRRPCINPSPFGNSRRGRILLHSQLKTHKLIYSVCYEPRSQLLRKNSQSHLPELQEQFSVKSLGIFGSYVRDQQHTDSDLDVLVNFNELPSLTKFIRLEDRLSELTGLEIDLVMEDGLKPNIGKRILKEVVRL